MKAANLKRKGYFFYYTLRPFRFSLVGRHVVKRMISFAGVSKGLRIIDLSLTNRCNFTCQHCSSALLDDKAPGLTLRDYQEVVRQAKYLDNLSWNLTGGEPLLLDWLEDLIPILKPAWHYITIQTNCSLLTPERARKLARLGVNCIYTSLDSADEKQHDRFRGYDGAWRKVFEGIRQARSAGMQALVGGTITHDKLYSADLMRMIEKTNKAGAIFLFNLAVPCGRWKNRKDILLTCNDRQYLQRLMALCPMTSTDHEVGRHQVGCPAGMEKIYITPSGEILPCPFIHVSFGNCRRENLSQIVTRMRQIPEFGHYQPLCLAAEDRVFQEKIFSAMYDNEPPSGPLSYRNVYNIASPQNHGAD